MPPSEERAHELPPLETPRSVQRLQRFVGALEQRRAIIAAPQQTASQPIGAVGLSAARFGVQLARHNAFSGVTHAADWGPARFGRYRISVADRRAFTPTLVHRKEAPSKTETPRLSGMSLPR